MIVKRKLWKPQAPAILRLVPRETALLLRHRRIMDMLRDPTLTPEQMIGLPFFWPNGVTITPGSSTFDNASGNFTVQPYNTLEIELWGGGGSSGSLNTTNVRLAGSAGVASTVASLSLSAGGAGAVPAAANTTTQNPGSVGTASGGDTNTNGNSGTGTNFVTQAVGSTAAGANAPGPGGGTGGAATAFNNSNNATQNGKNGGTPGAGGSSAIRSGFSIGGGWTHHWAASGSSGAYVKKTYTFGVTAGYPAYGASLAYVAGAGGPDPGTGDASIAGIGGHGRVKFTWS